MGIETLLIAALGGVLIGLLLTLFGGGGSVLATPWLIYVVGLTDPMRLLERRQLQLR